MEVEILAMKCKGPIHNLTQPSLGNTSDMRNRMITQVQCECPWFKTAVGIQRQQDLHQGPDVLEDCGGRSL